MSPDSASRGGGGGAAPAPPPPPGATGAPRPGGAARGWVAPPARGWAGRAACPPRPPPPHAVAKVSTAQESSGADTFQVRSFDPLTKGDLAFSCVRTEVIRCEGPAGEVVVIAR